MSLYDFTLKFALAEPGDDPATYVERLQRQGCDDALIGLGKSGRIALQFTREAESARGAVLRACRDVLQAIPGARFVEAAPDFVGVTDIAELLGFSRQYMAKVLSGAETTFPQPLHDGKRPIWHLQPVLQWFLKNSGRAIDPALLEIAEVTLSCNHVNQGERVPRDFPAEFRQIVA